MREIKNLVAKEMEASPIPIQVSSERKNRSLPCNTNRLKHVILTGGFASSPYLYTELRRFVSGNYDIVIQRPNVSYVTEDSPKLLCVNGGVVV